MATPPVRRLLVAVDFSPSSGEALRLACRMADALGASVEALHILEAGGPATAAPAPPSDADLASARERLRAFVAEARGACPVVVTERVEGGEVQARVVAAGEEGGFDLIVMGTHGRTGREHAFVGSVASSVVRTATRPVLTVREGTTAAS